MKVDCPRCHLTFDILRKCKRCGHTWTPRSEQMPVVCANIECKSPYWNKERVRTKRNALRKGK